MLTFTEIDITFCTHNYADIQVTFCIVATIIGANSHVHTSKYDIDFPTWALFGISKL